MSDTAPRRRVIVPPVIVLAVVGLIAVTVLASVHLVAQDALARSRDEALTPPERLAEAQTALRLEPWRRDIVGETAFIEGTLLRDQGDLDGAKRVLVAALERDSTDRRLRPLLVEVNREILVGDARKAHQQHGHEGPGGSLRPEDVER